jgi:hypothetical protein
MVAGQIFGGVLGDLVGWRGVFFLLSGLFLAIGALLLVELRSGRVPPPILSAKISPAAVIEAYGLLPGQRWARIVLATVFIEGFLYFGAFTFIGAYLHLEFDLDFAIVGVFLATTALGGLAYTLGVRRLVATLGERGLAVILGRGSPFILPEERTLRVLVVAPRPWRIERRIEETGSSAEEAAERIDRDDESRQRFLRTDFKVEPDDPRLYDLVVNTASLGIEGAALLIVQGLQQKVPGMTP